MTYQYITTTLGILGGKPCIKGTRISVELILEFIANGATPELITENYPQVSVEAVREAVLFADNSLRGEA